MSQGSVPRLRKVHGSGNSLGCPRAGATTLRQPIPVAPRHRRAPLGGSSSHTICMKLCQLLKGARTWAMHNHLAFQAVARHKVVYKLAAVRPPGVVDGVAVVATLVIIIVRHYRLAGVHGGGCRLRRACAPTPAPSTDCATCACKNYGQAVAARAVLEQTLCACAECAARWEWAAAELLGRLGASAQLLPCHVLHPHVAASASALPWFLLNAHAVQNRRQ